MPAVSTVSLTNNAYIDALLQGSKWAVTSLTFSFPTDPTFYGSGYASGENNVGFEAFNATQQTAARQILASYSSVINLTFSETTETAATHGDLRFAESDSPPTAWGYYPTFTAVGGDMWFNNSKNWYDDPQQGNFAWYTITHEIGHALGLKHPHVASGMSGTMPLDRDSVEYSVMSYRSYIGAGTGGVTNASDSFPQSLMMYDIAALQIMYGANFNTNGGDSVYRWDSNTGRMYINDVGQLAPNGNKIFRTVWDGGGNDTYDFSNYTTNLAVDLNPGAWTTVSAAQLANLGGGHVATGNIANALLYQGNTASLIENAIGGSGNDVITGNVANNKITGGGGNDFLDGGAGNDTACFSGALTSYSFVYNADMSWTVTDTRVTCPDGIDVLSNIEWLQFLDVLVRLDPSIFVPTIQPPSITGLLNDSEISGDRVTNNNQLILTGAAAASSTIKIYVAGVLIGSTVADSSGQWSFTSNALADGLHQVTATATDGSGTTSVNSAVFNVTIDTTAPNAPQITGFSPDSNVSGDRVTNQNILTLQGTAEANSQVHIYDGAVLLGVTTAGSNGQWSFASANNGPLESGCGCADCAAARAESQGSAALADGTHTFTAIAKDTAGNTSGTSTGYQVTIDTLVPSAPTITGFSPDSNVSGDGITNANQITLSGTAEAGSTVKIYDGATLIKTLIADGQGAWSFTTSNLSNATHNFTATATDLAGNISGVSSPLQVTVDAIAPSAPAITGFSPDTNVSGDGITNAGQVTLTGTAAAGSTVKVYDGATLIKTLVADSNGAWSFKTQTLVNGEHAFTVTGTDPLHGTSAPSQSLLVLVDTIAPNKPVLTALSTEGNVVGGMTNATSVNLTGTAEPGSVVTIMDGLTVLGMATVDENGSFSFIASGLGDGAHSFVAKAADAAGNQSAVSTALSLKIDSVGPAKPTISGYSPDSASIGDGITKASVIQLTGNAEAYSKVQVYDGGVLIGETIASKKGSWSFTTGTLESVTHRFEVVSIDAAQNSSSASDVLTVTVDTTAPSAPLILSYSPGVQNLGITNSNIITLAGSAEANCIIKIYSGSKYLGTTISDEGGNWAFTTAALANATHRFTATATDSAGNTSPLSTDSNGNPALSPPDVDHTFLVVKVDTIAPKRPVVTGFSNDTGKLEDRITSDSTLDFKGLAEAGAKIDVYDGATLLGQTLAGADGAWTFLTSELLDGNHNFLFKATDLAGNTSQASKPLSVQVDTTVDAPVILAVSPDRGVAGDLHTNAKVLALSGTSEAFSKVFIYSGETLIGTALANAAGVWSLRTPSLADGQYSFTAEAIDRAGNISDTSAPATVTVDTVAPNRPSVDYFSPDEGVVGDGKTNATTLTLGGRAGAFDQVTLYDGKTVIGSVVADENGLWTCTASDLASGKHNFSAVSSDVAGNISRSVTTLSVIVDATVPNPAPMYGPESGLTDSAIYIFSDKAKTKAALDLHDDGALLAGVSVDKHSIWTHSSETQLDNLLVMQSDPTKHHTLSHLFDFQHDGFVL